ncbi:hypothetical protein NP603_05770 [Methylomonas sp. SURF-1]|uniref:Uncharacterized protein n=1 Tax=Methylomonas aurea TaxID=2952224 RepID=A0ABT1UGQ0_9GAMM|nr:hypothetical protein [Methylomonas sp. SURF-1]MCQ8180606.1 hypothetical protein [Methylomonas sp. SURF-1]
MNPVWIDKTDVAERQIIEAVRLFFENRDPVVIHTIICSAHQILVDVGQDCGVSSAIKNPEGLSREQFREHIRAVNSPYNFFKHADKDPKGKLNIAPIHRFSSDFILDAILMFQGIAGSLPLEAKVFWAWFVDTYPEDFEDCSKDGALEALKEFGLADWDFPKIHQFLMFGSLVGEIHD